MHSQPFRHFFPILFFLISFAVGIGSGSSILIGQTYGGGKISKMKEVVGVTLAFTMLASAFVAILGSMFTANILRWMGTPENILQESIEYARILFVSLPITFMYMTYTTFLRGVGDSKTPLYALVLNTVLNITLLPLLMFGWLGLPAFGLNGAAYAAVFANFITFVFLIAYLYTTKHVLKPDRTILRNLYFKGPIVKKTFDISHSYKY